MKKRKLGRKLLSFLLSFAMVVGLMPGMSLTTYAATETYTALKNNATVVHFHNSDWYIIEDDSTSATEGTVTLLSADESFGMSVFNSEANNSYNASAVKAYLDKVVAGNAGEGKPDFSDVADAIKPVDLTTYNYDSETEVKETTDGAKLYLLDIAAARNLHNTIKNDEFEGATYDGWWLRSPSYIDTSAALFDGAWGGFDSHNVGGQFGVRPALKLNLSSVIFTSESNTFSLKPAEYNVTLSGGANATISGGATSQTGLTDAMTTVTYTANIGYHFADFTDITNNGITATRTSDTVVTISGTPTADATITVPDAVEKTAATVTKAPAAKTLTYTGSAQELVTAGEAEGGEMQYALGTKDDATEEYTTSIPTATDAGTYYVWYKASGNSDYEESEPGCVEVTIREDGQPDNDEGNSGIISVENHIGDGAPDCRLEIPEDTAYSLLTEAERNSLRNGSSARFYLEVSRIEPDEEERRLTEEMLEGISPDAKVGMYFDVSMYKEVGASSPVGITDLMGKRAEFAFDVPEELRGGKDVNREFYLLHIHNGVTELVTDSFKDQLIVGFTDLSTFVLLYVDREKTSGDPHVHVHHPCEKGHSFSYHVFQEPTTETDGYAGWVCDRCGIQDPDHADYVGPTGYIVLSAFPVFNDTLEKNIAAAPENGTVSISTKRWMSVRRGVLEALAARPDVTLSISFAYENEDYVLTIKGSDPNLAGFTASGDLFYGFIYLGNGFGLEQKTAEVPQS